jgi:malate dehydrogenase
MLNKITVVGAGNVGATVAQRMADKGYADVMLIDVVPGLPQGKALDMLEAGAIIGSDALVFGTNDYADTAGSDIVVIAAGLPRKPGMSRDDLLFKNMEIMTEVTRQIVKYSPHCILIVVTNPLDAMAQLAFEVSGFPKHRVIGMAGILDTSRFRTFIARELNVSVRNVAAFVLGGHGDSMVPLVGYTNVAGQPITHRMNKEQIDRIVQRTREGGEEIVGLLQTGSAFYAPSAAATQMVEAILFDRREILPCSVYLEGEYGVHGVFAGVPTKLGTHGIERVLEIELEPEELEAFKKSVETVRTLVEKMRARSAA